MPTPSRGLPREELLRLAGIIQGGGPEAMAAAWEVVLGNLALARTMAARFRSDRVSQEDAEQEACIGFYEAALSFDPERGTEFSTWAGWHARKRIQVAHRALKNQPHRAKAEGAISLDCLAPVADHRHEGDEAERLDRQDRINAVTQALRQLDHRKATVLRRRAQDHTLQEIAADLGVSRARVYQLENRAKVELTRQLKVMGIGP